MEVVRDRIADELLTRLGPISPPASIIDAPLATPRVVMPPPPAR
jgi:hypothetical protein